MLRKGWPALATALLLAFPLWNFFSGDEDTGLSKLAGENQVSRKAHFVSPAANVRIHPEIASGSESAKAVLPAAAADELDSPTRSTGRGSFFDLNRTVRGPGNGRSGAHFVGLSRRPWDQDSADFYGDGQAGVLRTARLSETQAGYLRSLEDRHRAVAGNLFGGLAPAFSQLKVNPFEGALDEAGATSGDSGHGRTSSSAPEPPSAPASPPAAEPAPPSPPPPGNPAGDSGVSTGAAGPAFGSQEQPGGGNASQPDSGQQESGRPTFLVIGDFTNAGTTQKIFEARRSESGAFLLENQIVFDPFSSLVGIPRASVLLDLDQGEQLVATDLNGDRLSDFLRVTPGFPVTSIEAFVRTGSVNFTRRAFGAVLFQVVQDLAVFDFNGDGVQELALLMGQSRNLFIYEFDGETIRSNRELVLPFEPAVLIELDGPQRAPLGERRLFIIDSTLTRAVYISSRIRGNLLVPASLPSASVRNLTLNAAVSGRPPLQVLAVQVASRILILKQSGARLQLLADLETRNGVPDLILGDVQSEGRWQLLYLP